MAFNVTQCPSCESTFNTNARILESAAGRVRCGACLTIFKATDNYIEGMDADSEYHPADSVFVGNNPEEFFDPSKFLTRSSLTETDETTDLASNDSSARHEFGSQAEFESVETDDHGTDSKLASEISQEESHNTNSLFAHEESPEKPLEESIDESVEESGSDEATIDEPVASESGHGDSDAFMREVAESLPGTELNEQDVASTENEAQESSTDQGKDKTETKSVGIGLSASFSFGAPFRKVETPSPEPNNEAAIADTTTEFGDESPENEAINEASEGEDLAASETEQAETESKSLEIVNHDEFDKPISQETEFLSAFEEGLDEELSQDKAEEPAQSSDQQSWDTSSPESINPESSSEEASSSPAVPIGTEALNAAFEELHSEEPNHEEIRNEGSTINERDGSSEINQGAEQSTFEQAEGLQEEPPASDPPIDATEFVSAIDRDRDSPEISEPILDWSALDDQTSVQSVEQQEHEKALPEGEKALDESEAEAEISESVGSGPSAEEQSAVEEPEDSTEAIRERALKAVLEDERALESIPEENIAALGKMSTPLELLQRKESRWGRRIALYLSVLMLVVLLAAQYLRQNFEVYSQQAQFRHFYELACNRLDCELPVYTDIGAIQSDNLAVRSHPQLANGLMVNIVIRNTADFPQPFPVLILSFNTAANGVVALREFSPAEYLDSGLQSFSEMPVMTPVQIELEIIDPGPDAVNYTLAFRLP